MGSLMCMHKNSAGCQYWRESIGLSKKTDARTSKLLKNSERIPHDLILVLVSLKKWFEN